MHLMMSNGVLYGGNISSFCQGLVGLARNMASFYICQDVYVCSMIDRENEIERERKRERGRVREGERGREREREWEIEILRKR